MAWEADARRDYSFARLVTTRGRQGCLFGRAASESSKERAEQWKRKHAR